LGCRKYILVADALGQQPAQKSCHPGYPSLERVMARKLSKMNEASDKATTVRIAVNVTKETPVYYINFVEVSNTPHEFSVTCARIPSKPTQSMVDEATNTGAITLNSDVQLVFPVGMLPGLVKALQTRREMYEKLFNITIKTPGEEGE
jgi:hypothetical protein